MTGIKTERCQKCRWVNSKSHLTSCGWPADGRLSNEKPLMIIPFCLEDWLMLDKALPQAAEIQGWLQWRN